MKGFLVLLAGLLPFMIVGAEVEDEDLYGEGALKDHRFKPKPGSEWVEQGLVLPPYPGKKNLIEVDISRRDFPYKVFVDGDSLSLGKDRVVRYTVIVRSKAGVDNVSFEGILCSRRQFKRYAYGANEKFYPLPAADWSYIRRQRQDIYRGVLAEDYFCPLPTGDIVAEIKDKLKRSSGSRDRYLFSDDQE